MTPSKPGGGSPSEDDLTGVRVTPAPEREPIEIDDVTVNTQTPPLPHARDPDLPPGMTLNEYQVDSKIGEGGMGMVFSAAHPVIGKRAAIKVLRRELCEDPVTLERFIDEARIVNQIGHPNIVDVFAFGTLPDGRHYLVMEWLKGEPLRARVARGKLNHLETAAILRALARALEAAHSHGVIHRDLKPDNVFIVEERDALPRVKLLDFGIAKLAREDKQVARTATGAMIGTPQYVAPEQAKGHAIDARVDIYSLGCVAFELLTGRPPFVADNAMEMVAKHLMEKPPRPSSLDKTIPRDLDRIIVEMMAKDRDDRPSLTEINAVLDSVAKQPLPRKGSAAAERTRDSMIGLAVTRVHKLPELVRKQWIAIGVAGMLAMAIAAFLGVSRLAASDEDKASVAPLPENPAPPPQAEPPAPAPPTVTPIPPPEPVNEVPKPPPPPAVPAHVVHKPTVAPKPPHKVTKPEVKPQTVAPAPPPPPAKADPKPETKAKPPVKPKDDGELMEPGALEPR